MTMNTTATATTTTTDPREKRLLGLAKGSRFAGFAYRDAEGRACATTDGAAFLVLDAETAEAAIERIGTLRLEGNLRARDARALGLIGWWSV